MKIIYQAVDGEQFDNAIDCREHEWMLKHPEIRGIIFLTKEDDVVINLFSEVEYARIEKIIINTTKELASIKELAEYTGFKGYSSIDSVGTWVYKNNHFERIG